MPPQQDFSCTIEYYSAMEKNKIMSFVGRWMEPEIVMLNKISQMQKDKYGMISLLFAT
jgi:hypothetical protein